MARDFGESSRGGLRGSYPEPGLGWQLRLRPSAHAVVPEFMRAAFVFPSTAVAPMANAGEVPEFSHWGYAESLSEPRGFPALRTENEPHSGSGAASCVAGRLWL